MLQPPSVPDNFSINSTFFPSSLREAVAGWYCLTLVISIAACLMLAIAILSIFKHPSYHAGTSVLVSHVFITELLLSTIAYPVLATVTFIHINYHPLPHTVCKVPVVLTQLVQITSNWSFCVLAISRLMSVGRSSFHDDFNNRWCIGGLVMIPWVIGFSFGGAMASGAIGGFGISAGGACGTMRLLPAFLHSRLALGYLLPLVLTGIIYVVLSIRIRNVSRRIAQVKEGPALNHLRNRMKINTSLSVSYVWYAACYLPAPIVHALPDVFLGSGMVAHWLRTLAQVGFLGNPIIFLAINREYRFTLLRIIADFLEKQLADSRRAVVTTGRRCLQRMSALTTT